MVLLLFSCQEKKPKQEIPDVDNATAGRISIAVDETYRPIIEAQLNSFHSTYKFAEITPVVKSEAECFQELLNENVRVVIGSRKLNAEEMAIFDERKIVPTQTKVATDAIALIVNQESADTQMTMEQVRSVFRGETAHTIVVDHSGSGTVRYIKDEILGGAPLPSNIFSASTNPGVIDFVSKNKGAIGVIGVNWVSDRDSPEVEESLSKVRLLALEANDSSVLAGQFVQPYQTNFADKSYPMIRDVICVSREPRMGLGTGFVNYIAGEKGQRIFLKSGLYPEFMPPRLVKFPPKEGAEDINKVILEEMKEEKEKNDE